MTVGVDTESLPSGSISKRPGLELAQGHRGHGLWCPLPWPWCPIFQGILQYIVASGALVQWPWNECPSKFVIRALEATLLKSSGLTNLYLHNWGKSKLIVTDVGLTNLMESIAQQMQWVLGLRYCPRLIRCPNHDHCSCINLVSWILLSKISNRPIKLKSLTVSRFTFMLDHVI